jgi:LysR family nitrogen assimilation transcriptional regulator
LTVGKFHFFVRVAEAGTISRAADQLKMAQPALSRYIRELEDEIGARLFERTGRGVALTQDGQRLYRHAKAIIDQLEAAELEVADPAGLPLTTVRLGIVPWLTEILAVPLIESLRREMPRVALQVIEGHNASLLEWLDQGVVDVAVSFYEFHLPHIEVETVFDQELYLLGSAHSPELAAASAIALRDIASLALVLPSSPHPLRLGLEQKALEAGRGLNVVLETESASIAAYIAQAGMGFTLIPQAACRDLEARGLKAVRIVDPPMTQDLVVMTSLRRPPSTAERDLHRLVLAHLRAIDPRSNGPSHDA